MTNVAIALPAEDQTGTSQEEPLLSIQTHPAVDDSSAADRHAARFPAPVPDYFDDVQPPRLSDLHLRNSRVLACREEIIPRLPMGGVYAEVGAQTGYIAKQMLSLLNPAKLYICDTDLSSFDIGPFQTAIAQQLVELHQGQLDAQWQRLPDGLFDLIYIHPDHNYSLAMSALQEAARKINDRGWIVCTDYPSCPPLEGIKHGVCRAVNEFCHQGGFEILYLALHPLGCQDAVLARRSPREPEHLGGAFLEAPDANTFMPDVWEHLIHQYGIQSVLDVGAGAGWSTKWFVEKGLYTLGIEGWKEALDKSRCRSNVVEHDYTQGSFVPACRFDLGWCAEFVEHVEERFIPNFMASLQSCKYVCLTHSEPGQFGFHHVNCQSTDYWINKMQEYGFDHDQRETLHLRSTDTQKALWGRRSLTFFVRNDDPR
jgi:SAM-dependent methyltransferase